MSDRLPAKSGEPRVRYWDHNFKEIHPPDNLNIEHVTVDYDGMRWSARTIARSKLDDDGVNS